MRISGMRTSRIPLHIIPAFIVLIWLLLAAFIPHLLTSTHPLAVDPAASFGAPGEYGILGTDELGRDIYSRIVYGARDSLAIGFTATSLGVGIGLVLGVVAGYAATATPIHPWGIWAARFLDAALTWIMNVMFAMPTLVLALLFVAIRGPGVSSAIIAIGLATAPGFARMIRAQVIQIRGAGYIQQSITLGESPGVRLRRHILPNALSPMVSMVALGVAQSIVWVCALSFLGLGSLPPDPEWGAMLNSGRMYLLTGWWMMLMPGLAITITALALTALGRWWAAQGVHTS